MSSHNEEPEIYAITRRTPRSIGLGWGGTVLFMIGLISAFFLGWFYFVRIISDVFAIQWCIFTGLFLILGIILWRASANAEYGTLLIFDDKVSCRCERTIVDIKPDQITSVYRYRKNVFIVFSGKTLSIHPEEPSALVRRLNEYVDEYNHPEEYIDEETEPETELESDTESEPISPDKIREYKQLVDDGLITQAQYDAIIERLVKS